MRKVLRWVRNIVVLLVLAGAVLWFFGPREPADTRVQFDPSVIGPDLEAWLTAEESRFADITPGAQKRIHWAGEPGQRTPIALVYIHGFSATSEEIRPVPDEVARRLGANLFYTRLAGHGRGPEAMAEPRVADWMRDLAEAMEIGRRLGDRVVLVTTSTGGTLAIAGLTAPQIREGLAGLVLISPNFGPADPMAELANWPLARWWIPLLVGEWREWAPRNPEQATWWTTRYPTVAVLPMMALVRAVREMDLSEIDLPALFIWSPDDKVVDPSRTEAAYEAWGGPKERILVTVGPQDDPASHVIAGDILSPSRTEPTVEAIVDWIERLPAPGE